MRPLLPPEETTSMRRRAATPPPHPTPPENGRFISITQKNLMRVWASAGRKTFTGVPREHNEGSVIPNWGSLMMISCTVELLGMSGNNNARR